MCANYIAELYLGEMQLWRRMVSFHHVVFLLAITAAEAAQTFSKVRSRDQSNKFDNTVDAHLHGGVLGDPGPGCIHVNTSRHRLVDGYGREKYFHGVNVVVKGPPWIPRQDEFDPHWSFVKADMELLQAWGLNAIRYGMMWPGVEPEKGQYNQTYIDASKDLINQAAKYGIYTLLDAHQDVLSQKFCGEGIPDWAVDTGTSLRFPVPVDTPFDTDPNTTYPSTKDCSKRAWGDYYFSEATSVAFENLYKNKNGLRDSFAAFWAKVAQEFVDNPFVIGYEILNEPWAGNIYENPLLLLPKVADRDNFAPFYEAVHTELRKYDKCHSFFFESITWDEGEVGFEQVPGGEDYTNRSVLAWHFYIPPLFDNKVTFAERDKDVERLKCGGFLSEFSINDYSTMEEADRHLTSWLAWDYKGYTVVTGSFNPLWNGSGELNMDLVRNLSRTYAQTVAGVAVAMTYDPESKDFTLQYYTTAACSSNATEIFLNEVLHYKEGYSVSVDPSEKVQWTSPATNYITVTHSPSLPEGTLITVKISKKTK